MVSDMMRAWVSDGTGDVALVDLPVPVPAPDQALVKCCSAMMARGQIRHLPQIPYGRILGSSFAGIVQKQAADGSGPPKGSRVAGHTGYSGGGWGQMLALPASNLGVVPDGISWAEAAYIAGNGLTAFFAVSHGGFLVGRRVLVTGVNGKVGRLAAQIARIGGAKVTGTVSRPERAAAAEPLRLDAVALDTEVEGPFDLVVETIGGGPLARALKVAGPDGVVVTLGGGDGFDAPSEPAIVPNGWFFDHPCARLESENVAERAVRRTGVAANLRILGELAADGKLMLDIEEEVDWLEMGNYVARVKAGEPINRRVFLID